MVRSGPLSHPEIQRAITESCVPVVFDLCRILPYRTADSEQTADTEAYGPALAKQVDDDPEIAAFLAIQRQQPLIKGIWITTPDGRVLCSSSHVTAEPLLALLTATIANWQPSPNALPLPQAASTIQTADGTFEMPVDSVPLVVQGRLVDNSNAVYRDVIILSRDECRQLLPNTIRIGESIALPEGTLKRLVTRLHPGEMRLALTRDDVRSVAAEVTITNVDAGVAYAELNGTVDVDGVWVRKERRRRHQATLSGTIRWDIERQVPTAIEIVSDGTWQAEYPEGFNPGGDFDTYPGGPSGRLAMSPPMRMLFLVELAPVQALVTSN